MVTYQCAIHLVAVFTLCWLRGDDYWDCASRVLPVAYRVRIVAVMHPCGHQEGLREQTHTVPANRGSLGSRPDDCPALR